MLDPPAERRREPVACPDGADVIDLAEHGAERVHGLARIERTSQHHGDTNSRDARDVQPVAVLLRVAFGIGQSQCLRQRVRRDESLDGAGQRGFDDDHLSARRDDDAFGREDEMRNASSRVERLGGGKQAPHHEEARTDVGNDRLSDAAGEELRQPQPRDALGDQDQTRAALLVVVIDLHRERDARTFVRLQAVHALDELRLDVAEFLDQSQQLDRAARRVDADFTFAERVAKTRPAVAVELDLLLLRWLWRLHRALDRFRRRFFRRFFTCHGP